MDDSIKYEDQWCGVFVVVPKYKNYNSRHYYTWFYGWNKDDVRRQVKKFIIPLIQKEKGRRGIKFKCFLRYWNERYTIKKMTDIHKNDPIGYIRQYMENIEYRN